jgi:large subunit ribosomal protein L19
MNSKVKEIEQATIRKEKLEFSVGDSVKVHNLIREGEKERVQIYEGVVLKRQGGGNRETFTVRKNSNGVGVEKTFPVNSPMVVKVEVVRKGKARRAKLNYLRERIGKAAKVKEDLLNTQDVEA